MCGDGHCDLPGLSEKFCTYYTMMDIETNLIVQCVTVDKSEVSPPLFSILLCHAQLVLNVTLLVS